MALGDQPTIRNRAIGRRLIRVGGIVMICSAITGVIVINIVRGRPSAVQREVILYVLGGVAIGLVFSLVGNFMRPWTLQERMDQKDTLRRLLKPKSGSDWLMLLAVVFPLIGFVGTACGVYRGIRGFSEFLKGSVTSDEIRKQVSLITDGLSAAFCYTLIGLSMGIACAIASSLARKRETKDATL